MTLRAIFFGAPARALRLPAFSIIAVAGALSASAQPAGAQPASVHGATFEAEARPLRALVDRHGQRTESADTESWLGYRIPKAAGSGSQCCYDRDRSAGCRLTSTSRHYYGYQPSDADTLQPGRHLLVFLPPAADRGRHRVLAYDSACPLDAEGLRIRWLGDVPVSDSLQVLTPWTTDKDRSALHAIALHDGDQATNILASVARRTTASDDLRTAAAFWLAAHRGADGYRVVGDLLATAERPSLREDLVAALAQSKVPEALDQLIDIARHDRSARVRGQGLFWLAQTASNRVPKVLMEAAERDPEAAVKKKAVFAISQLPNERGVPLLINVAEQHSSAAVRERAIFWLGQSEDPRALEFIISLLFTPST